MPLSRDLEGTLYKFSLIDRNRLIETEPINNFYELNCLFIQNLIISFYVTLFWLLLCSWVNFWVMYVAMKIVLTRCV